MLKPTLLALSLSVTLAACSKSEKSQSENMNGNLPQAAVANSEVQIKVPTIQCESCVANVEAALKEVEGVSSTKIDLETKLAQVNFDPAKTNLSAMEKAIAMAGYDANDIKRDSTAYADLDACCKLPEDRGSK
jgi:copper chaperone CopZ